MVDTWWTQQTERLRPQSVDAVVAEALVEQQREQEHCPGPEVQDDGHVHEALAYAALF